MHFLTGDFGNTSCKLRLWKVEGTRGVARAAGRNWPSSRGIGEPISAWLAGLPRAQGCAVSSVASADLETELVRALAALAPDESAENAARFPDAGLEIACRAPECVGRDRLFAARGALEICGENAIVVDAGTALTVDAVRADGTFLGGAIAPGPNLLAEALARGTARLPRIVPRTDAVALGRSTEEALQSGVVLGFRGAARELVREVAAESGCAPAVAVVTGGARRFLLDSSLPSTPAAVATFGALRVLEEEDLVHLGLLAACGIASGRRPG